MAAALLALAAGIGGCSIIFSIVNAIYFQSLPYPEADRLILVTERNPGLGVPGMSSSPANFGDYLREAHSFQSLAAYRREDQILLVGDLPERVAAIRASGQIFNVFGVPPALGTTLERGNDSEEFVVVLGHELWQRRFGGDPALVGKSIQLDGRSYTVVGIMPEGFDFPPGAELWRPLVLSPEAWADRQGHYLSLVGRLAPGASQTSAQREMDVLSARLARQYPDFDGGWSSEVQTLQEKVTAPDRPLLLVLLASGGLLLVLVCGNLTNLLLARGGSRGPEIALRTALGASGGGLIRQLLTETAVLTLAGGFLGLGVAWLATRALVRLTPGSVLRWRELDVDWRVALFTLALALLTGIAAGLVPAIRLARADLRTVLSRSSSRISVGWRRNRLATLLAMGQIALSFTLLTGAGLLFRSFQQLVDVEPGFDAGNVLTFRIELPESPYENGPRRIHFFAQALERLRALPGVASAGAVSSLPLAGSNNFVPFSIPGRPPGEKDFAPFYAVTPGYLETLRIHLVRGRIFGERDRSSPLPTALLSDSMARQYFPGQDPVGRQILLGSPPNATVTEIVGVVADIRAQTLESEGGPQVYGLHDRAPVSAMTLCLKTRTPPLALVPAVRQVIAEIDPHQPIDEIAALDRIVRESVAGHQLALLAMGAFALIALILAIVGIYGVLSHMVGGATREIGIRAALGAGPSQVQRLVLSYAVLVLGWGLPAGAAGAFAVSHLLESQLFGVTRTDSITYGIVAALLATTVLAACLTPARRAAKVDPTVTLNEE